jgi:hypothetical protein
MSAPEPDAPKRPARRGRYKRQVREPIGPPDPVACEQHKDLIRGLKLIVAMHRLRRRAAQQEQMEQDNAKNQVD